MLDFNSILVSSPDPEKLSDFYQKVLEKKPDWKEGTYFGFMAGKGYITFGPHDKVSGTSKNPERIILDFETKDVKGEFDRIKSLGAKVVAEPYAMKGVEDYKGWIATFADPDGNYFQLMSPWQMEK